MNDRPTIADRYANIDPDTLTVDQVLTYTLINEVVGLREDVVEERAGRQEAFRVMRRGQRLAATAVAAIVLVSAILVGSWVQQGRVTCETRQESAARIRSAVGAAVDEGAIKLGAKASTRHELDKAVADRVITEYPPPRC